MKTENEIKIVHGQCKNCGETILKVPLQETSSRKVWVWRWIHEQSEKATCDKVFYAEPGPFTVSIEESETEKGINKNG